jgi:hypothetical protein
MVRPGPTQPQPAPTTPTAALIVELDVEDNTRKERWFESLLREELATAGVNISTHPGEGAQAARYILHVRIEARGSDHGLAIEKNRAQSGSTRIDSASDGDSESEAFREAPPTETPAYKRHTTAEGRTVQTVDDFDLLATATVLSRESKVMLATSSFDERALGIQPVAQTERGREWRVVYRGVAQRVARWLQEQKLR